MTLTAAQKVAVRRYCGYPMLGNDQNPAFGYRFSTQYGAMEYALNRLLPEEAEVVVEMLATLKELETAIPTASENLDTSSAGPWVHNKKETAHRVELYQFHRRELCSFLGVPPGPKMPSSGISWSL